MEYEISFFELNSILFKLKPGDFVFILDGIYNNVQIDINVFGSLENRISIQSKTPGKVILSGNTRIILSGKYITLGNFIFENGGGSIELHGYGNRLAGSRISFNESDGPIISVFSQNNRVDHCIIENFSRSGVWLEIKRSGDLDYALIDHNIFRNRAEGNGNGFETIRIGTSGASLTNSRTLVYANMFEKCDGEIEIISVKSSENIIYKNVFKDSKGSLTLRHGNRNIVAKNKFLQNNIEGASGIRILGEDHLIYKNYLSEVNNGDTIGSAISISNGIPNSRLNGYLQVKRVKILNNILLNNNFDFAFGIQQSGGNLLPLDLDFENNIVYKTNQDIIFSYEGFGLSNPFFLNNKYYGYNLGKKPNGETSNLLDPLTFKLDRINENKYGTTDIVGVRWDLFTPESSELRVEVNDFYDKIKNEITTEISGYVYPTLPPNYTVPTEVGLVDTDDYETITTIPFVPTLFPNSSGYIFNNLILSGFLFLFTLKKLI